MDNIEYIEKLNKNSQKDKQLVFGIGALLDLPNPNYTPDSSQSKS